MSPGPRRSVGCGGIVASVDTGTAGAKGRVAVLVTSTSVNGNCPVCATAACLISIPVGPLDGRLAQPLKASAAADTKVAPRNDPLRCGTRKIDID